MGAVRPQALELTWLPADLASTKPCGLLQSLLACQRPGWRRRRVLLLALSAWITSYLCRSRLGGCEGAQGVGDAAALLDDLLVAALGFDVPLPLVLVGGDLRGGAAAVLLGEGDVVVLAEVEGRVEVDEVYGGVRDVVAENLEVVAIVELVSFVHICDNSHSGGKSESKSGGEMRVGSRDGIKSSVF